MTFKSYFEHSEPPFNDLQILDLYKINSYLTCLFMFRYYILQNLGQKCLKIIFQKTMSFIVITRQKVLHYYIKHIKEQTTQNILSHAKELMYGMVLITIIKKQDLTAHSKQKLEKYFLQINSVT